MRNHLCLPGISRGSQSGNQGVHFQCYQGLWLVNCCCLEVYSVPAPLRSSPKATCEWLSRNYLVFGGLAPDAIHAHCHHAYEPGLEGKEHTVGGNSKEITLLTWWGLEQSQSCLWKIECFREALFPPFSLVAATAFKSSQWPASSFTHKKTRTPVSFPLSSTTTWPTSTQVSGALSIFQARPSHHSQSSWSTGIRTAASLGLSSISLSHCFSVTFPFVFVWLMARLRQGLTPQAKMSSNPWSSCLSYFSAGFSSVHKEFQLHLPLV